MILCSFETPAQVFCVYTWRNDLLLMSEFILMNNFKDLCKNLPAFLHKFEI